MKRLIVIAPVVLTAIMLVIVFRSDVSDPAEVSDTESVSKPPSPHSLSGVAPILAGDTPNVPPQPSALVVPETSSYSTRMEVEKPDWEVQKTQSRIRSINQRYRALFDELAFNEKQRAEFLAIRLNRMERGDRLIERMRANGVTPDIETTRVVFDQTGAEMENELKEAFGADIYRKMEAYENSVPARGIVNELAISLQYGQDTLSSMQAGQLVRIIAENSINRSTGKVDLAHVDVNAISRATLSLLTPVQQQTLEQILEARTAHKPLSITGMPMP